MSPLESYQTSISGAGAEMSHVGLTAADLHAPHLLAPGAAEAHAISAAIMPGAEHALLGPMVPGAGEPISPLIQLIMRMPGQIGLLHNFFEALAGFFAPYLHNLLPAFDPSFISMHAHASHLTHALSINPHAAATHFRLPGSEHMAVDMSLIPRDAPIFHGSAFSNSAGFMSGDKFMIGHSELINPRSALNVNGGLDLNNPQFEGGSAMGSVGQRSELLSGPSISDNPVGTHLAGTQRLFSDRIQGTYFAKQGMGAALASVHGNAAGLSQTVPLGNTPISGSQALTSNSLNTGTGSLPTAQTSSMSASDLGTTTNIGNGGADSAMLGNSSGSSVGTLGDHLAANSQQTVAWNTGGDAFKPALGAGGTDYGASYLKSQPIDTSSPGAGHAPTTGGDHPLKGLKAKELTLDGKAAPSEAPHKAVDSVGHEAKAGHSGAGHAMDQISHHETHKVAYDAPATHHAAPVVHHTPPPAPKPAAPKVKPHEVAKAAEPKAVEPKEAADPNTATDATNTATDNTAGTGDSTAAAGSDIQPTSYTIRAGDCLWNIAKDKLGSGLKWQEIYNMNKDVLGSNPDLVYSGTNIKLPGGGADIAGAGAGAGTYVVKSGDCLWNIAKNQMHDATKWGDLYKANTDIIGTNPRLIMPGQHLNLPGADHSQMVADATGSTGASAGTGAGAAAGGDQALQATTGSATPTAGGAAPGSGEVATYGAPGAPAMDGTGTSVQTMPAAEVQPAMQPMTPGMHPSAPALQPASPALQQTIPSLQNSAPAVAPMGSHAALPPTSSTPALSMGPGAAGAATLHAIPVNAVPTVAEGATSFQPQLVNSSTGADLAAFLAKKK